MPPISNPYLKPLDNPTPVGYYIRVKETNPTSMNKTLTALTALAAVVVTGAPAMANTIDAHNRLLSAVKSTGLQVKINPPECDTDNALGWYWAARNEMVICQENKIKGSSQQVYWTAEDLDTIRHEAHHLVQDCMGTNFDGHLDSVYNKPLALGYDVLGAENVHSIASSYAQGGADNHTQVMEVEAFAVAAMNDPAEQVRDIQRFCF